MAHTAPLHHHEPCGCLPVASPFDEGTTSAYQVARGDGCPAAKVPRPAFLTTTTAIVAGLVPGKVCGSGKRRSGRGAPWFRNRQHDSRRLRRENRSTGRQPPEGFDSGSSPNDEQNGESRRVATFPSSLTPEAVQRVWELALHHLPGAICPELPFGPQVRAPRPAAPMSVSAAVSDSRQPQNRSQRSELDSATSCFPASPRRTTGCCERLAAAANTLGPVSDSRRGLASLLAQAAGEPAKAQPTVFRRARDSQRETRFPLEWCWGIRASGLPAPSRFRASPGRPSCAAPW